jgi:hypothetical protein
MAPLCAEFGISRKTGYKIFDRNKACGLEALTERSRRPYRQANRLGAGQDYRRRVGVHEMAGAIQIEWRRQSNYVRRTFV